MPGCPCFRRFLPILAAAMLGLPAAPSLAGASREPGFRDPGTADGLLIGAGLALAGIGRWALDTDVREVPDAGFNPTDIEPGWDRRSLHPPGPGADDASQLALAGTALWPVALTWLSAPGWDWDAQLRGRRVQFESAVVAFGAASMIKSLVSRARPFTYQDAAARSVDATYDATADGAFESFPSGHATLAWSSVTAGTALLAAERPDLPPGIHFAAGALGGALATSTSLLRVESGQHSPSDAAAGAALGFSTGIAVPLLRLDTGREGVWRSWRAGLLGLAAGAVIAGLVTPPTSPWID